MALPVLTAVEADCTETSQRPVTVTVRQRHSFSLICSLHEPLCSVFQWTHHSDSDRDGHRR